MPPLGFQKLGPLARSPTSALRKSGLDSSRTDDAVGGVPLVATRAGSSYDGPPPLICTVPRTAWPGCATTRPLNAMVWPEPSRGFSQQSRVSTPAEILDRVLTVELP